MRGSDKRSGELFSYVDLEQRIRHDHALRAVRALTDTALAMLSGDFAALYSGVGRPSIAPEMLLRAMLLQAFYSVRSERQLMERLEFDLLFRWFVGLGVDDAVWDHSSFSKNRDRLLEGEIAARFLSAVLAQPRIKRLLSSEHFSVDGTLIEAWASIKSFKPKEPSDGGGTPGGGRNAPVDFRGEKRSNQTHRSTTAPDARLYRKGPGMEAKLCFIGHGLMENRSGLIVDARLTRVSGHAERLAALDMIEGVPIVLARSHWALTRVTMPPILSRNCARSTCARLSPATPAADVRRSIGAPRAIPATPRASAFASGLRRRLAGSRLSPGCVRPSCAACPRSTGVSPSPLPPTICSERRS
jgi:transposase